MTTPSAKPRIPRAIWALGFVSLLMDVSSELIHSLLPVFMFTALGLHHRHHRGHGGGASVTPLGQRFLKCYATLESHINEATAKELRALRALAD